MSKAKTGNFFEDFHAGQVIRHATPRTITSADITLYAALYGTRFAVQSAKSFARKVGYPQRPADDLLVFHIVFGKSVPDVSLNAIANLGYAECVFQRAVYPGDTLTSVSEVIGVKENSNAKSGTVHVRTTGSNQAGETVLSFVRWVMVRKRDEAAPAPEPVVPVLAGFVPPEALGRACPPILLNEWDDGLSGSVHHFADYAVGERIDHIDGMTVEEAEHMLATRLYQNTAKVHFNQFAEKDGRFGRRIVYGGHAISLARALSFNGLGNAFHVAAVNGGRHAAPLFAGATVFAWSEITGMAAIPGRSDVGALRVVTRATADVPCTDHPAGDGVILELDYWALIPA